MAEVIAGYPDDVLTQILKWPAAVPPPGVIAASTANESTETANSAVLGLSVSISTIALSLRMYTNLRLRRQWYCEDALLVIAWILLLFFSAEALMSVKYGACRHLWNVLVGDFLQALYYINVTAILYCIIVALVKIAILIQYLRIFVTNRGPLFWAIWVTIGAIFVFYTTLSFLTIFICNPREAYWDPFVKGHCQNWQALAQAVCIFTVISDFAVLLLPLYTVAKLHMPKRKKIMIGLLFAMGFIDCVASIVRTYYTWILIASPDISWNITLMAMWSWIEMAFGILVASLPVTPRFFKHVKQKARGVTGSGSGQSGSWRSSRLRFYRSSGNSSGRTHPNGVRVKTEVKISSSPASGLRSGDAHFEDKELMIAEMPMYPNQVYTGEYPTQSKIGKGSQTSQLSHVSQDSAVYDV